jgi:hypothetical protein
MAGDMAQLKEVAPVYASRALQIHRRAWLQLKNSKFSGVQDAKETCRRGSHL